MKMKPLAKDPTSKLISVDLGAFYVLHRGREPGLVVMGGVACPEGPGFESMHH